MGNAAGTLAFNAMNAEIQRLGITDPMAINTLKNLAVTVAGAGVGGTAGAAAAFNADANNRQLHPDEYATARRIRKVVADRLGISEAEAEGRIVRQMQRNMDYQTALSDGFRVDEQIVGLVGCQILLCNYYKSNADYFDPQVNAQYIPGNLSSYRAAVAQRDKGLSAAELQRRALVTSTALGVVSSVYGLAESANILLYGKNFLGEDESRWWGAAGLGTLGLARVGKVYELRHFDELGEVLLVNAAHLNPKWLDAAGDLTWRNPITNLVEKIPAGNVVHVDHIFARNAAEGIEGWNLLTKAEQTQLLNSTDNLQPMLASANCSKGCRVEPPSGTGWETWLGQPINAGYKKYLEGVQSKVRIEIEKAIAKKLSGG